MPDQNPEPQMADSQTPDVLAQAQAALKKSDEAIAASQTALAKIQEDIKRLDEENEKAQAAIDSEITEIVQEMDEDVLGFVKDTE